MQSKCIVIKPTKFKLLLAYATPKVTKTRIYNLQCFVSNEPNVELNFQPDVTSLFVG